MSLTRKARALLEIARDLVFGSAVMGVFAGIYLLAATAAQYAAEGYYGADGKAAALAWNGAGGLAIFCLILRLVTCDTDYYGETPSLFPNRHASKLALALQITIELLLAVLSSVIFAVLLGKLGFRGGKIEEVIYAILMAPVLIGIMFLRFATDAALERHYPKKSRDLLATEPADKRP